MLLQRRQQTASAHRQDHPPATNIVMSLYQQNFTLLPVPRRTIFSHGDEATRFKLPDCASVAELQQHTTRLLLIPSAIPAYWTHSVIGASIVCVLIIVTALIIVRRMYDRSFWLVRVWRRPSGIVIVPNTLLAFTLCEGAFGVLFVTFCWMLRSWFYVHTRLPHGVYVWVLMMWYPLACGPLVAVYGTYFAIPSSLLTAQPSTDEGEGEGEGGTSRTEWLRRLASHSIVLNVTAIALPLIALVTILTPTLIANARHANSLQQMLTWIAKYEGQTAFTEEMVHDAQRVWFELGYSSQIAAKVCALWVAYAFSLSIAYSWVTMRLLRVVGAELRKNAKAGEEHTMIVTQFVVSEGQDMSALSRREDDDMLRAIELDLWRSRQLDSKASHASMTESMITPTSSTMMASDYARRRTVGHASRKRVLLTRLRKLIPNIVAQTAAHPHLSSVPPSQDHQTRELRKAYRHHLVQAMAIAPGCFIFTAIATWCAMTMASSVEQPVANGGSRLSETVPQLMFTVTWVVVVLGSIAMLAIAQRTYEPVLNSRKRTSTGSSAGRNELGGRGQLEQVQPFFLPSASAALASRLGEGITSFGVAQPTHSVTSIRATPLRNMASLATLEEAHREVQH